jgi:carbonic anhydrase
MTTTPDFGALILTCADHRVDPAHVLGLDLGEAVVMRNPGGRVTPAFIQEIAVLAVIAGIEGIESDFELIIMHHTDCGMSRLGEIEHSALLAHYFGVDEGEIPGKYVADPVASVRADLDALRSNPLIPATLVGSGVVYDVDSRRIDTVCPPARLGEA